MPLRVTGGEPFSMQPFQNRTGQFPGIRLASCPHVVSILHVRGRSLRLYAAFRGPPPPTERAMKNDFIEGDEWDAYVALDTFSAHGTRDGLPGASPRVTESP